LHTLQTDWELHVLSSHLSRWFAN